MTASASGRVPQTAREVRGSAAVIPLAGEPPRRSSLTPLCRMRSPGGWSSFSTGPKICASSQYSGPGALDVSPRIGHLHLTVDGGPWHWVDASGEPLIIQSLAPGPHRVLIELADPTHRVIDQAVVNLVIPAKK